MNDGNDNSNSATSTITVTPVNDAPIIATNTGTTVNEGSSNTIINKMCASWYNSTISFTILLKIKTEDHCHYKKFPF